MKGAAKLLGLALLVLMAGLVWRLPTPELTPPAGGFELLDRDGRILRRLPAADGYWRFPITLERVDPSFLRYLIAYEDRRYHHHPGVDPLALVRALGQWLWHGRIVSGASTLTMQTVRLMHPRPRTLASKAVEMIQALKLEWRHDKARILEHYLNLAPYGGNIQGVRAAALLYFGHEPDRLTLSEAALLIALPQSPEKRRPDRHPEAARAARDRVLERLVEQGLISQEQRRLAAAEPLPRRRPTPFEAPHLADRLHRLHPQATRLTTTLDGRLQRRLQALARRHRRLASGETFAVMVIDRHSRQVLAHLGSADYLAHSQLDLTRALRSPGSTLKPFIYGLAFEQGKLHPLTRIADRPYRQGDYDPKNFDGRFHGFVTARDALIQSLNVPAVKVLKKVGAIHLLERFEAIGLPLKLPKGARPNLAIALGGAGTTLEALVALYAAIGEGGRFEPLRYLASEPPGPRHRLLGTQAAAALDRILRATVPPSGFRRHRALRFKTGTSYGYRDAWAIGYDDHYAVGVWVGHPDGSAEPGRTGITHAAPLLFQIFALLPGAERDPPPPPPFEAPPPRLRWFQAPREGGAPLTPALQIRFPLDGSHLVVAPGTPLPLEADGGRPPYHWLVDGKPLAERRRRVQWLPTGGGQVRITLIDAEGTQRRVQIWLELD